MSSIRNLYSDIHGNVTYHVLQVSTASTYSPLLTRNDGMLGTDATATRPNILVTNFENFRNQPVPNNIFPAVTQQDAHVRQIVVDRDNVFNAHKPDSKTEKALFYLYTIGKSCVWTKLSHKGRLSTHAKKIGLNPNR